MTKVQRIKIPGKQGHHIIPQQIVGTKLHLVTDEVARKNMIKCKEFLNDIGFDINSEDNMMPLTDGMPDSVGHPTAFTS